jgi:pimeloyl-ACP methyl ester carboxylesterase
VPLGPGGRFSVVYRSFALKTPNPAIERGLVIIHGAGRNADDYFASGMAGALIAGAMDNTVVISPRLASNSGSGCADKLAEGEISWTCGGENDWRRGGAAHGLSNVYTYDLLDEVVKLLADKKVFPNLKAIVITGHSAGGQVTNRYAASARAEKTIGLPVKYVVSNPSSYLYLDNRRMAAGAACTSDGKCTGEFVPFAGTEQCGVYNLWHYGMDKRSGYAGKMPDQELRSQLIARNVTYLLGELDTLPLFGFDSSCGAMAQGPNRYARGLNYWNYMRNVHGAKHELVRIDACGHNGRCMYTANEALPVLFPKN